MPVSELVSFARRNGAKLMEWSSAAANVALASFFLVVGLRLLETAKRSYAAAGVNVSDLTVDYAWRVATSPGLDLRAKLWAEAWLSGVLAAGCLYMAVLGGRWAWWRLHEAVRGRT